MASKIVILLLLALTVTKACNLDWILEDVYDDSDSEEDDSSEKPGNNQNTSTTPAPSESVTTKPFPVIPATAGAAPDNNLAPSNSTSRALKENPTEKRRHRRTHHRRRLIRTIPTQNEFVDQTHPNEGRGFNAEVDQFSLLGRFAPLTRKKLVQERTFLPIEKEDDMEEARAFTSHDFGTKRRVILIRSPESRRENADLEQNTEEEDQLEPTDFIKIIMEPLGRKNVEEQDDEPLIPEERMESWQLGDSADEEQPESADLDRDVGELVRSFIADKLRDDPNMSELEIPLGRMENLRPRQNMGKRKQSSQHSINSSRRRIIKIVTPSTMRMSESDVRKYAKEYLRKLLLRDTEGKIFESKRYVYIPVPKKVLNKKRHHSHSSRPQKQKGSNVVSIINREYFYEMPEIEHLKNEEQESYLTLLLPQTPPKKPERPTSTQHLMLNNQNPRRPILIDPYESYTEKLEDLPQEIKNPSINHVNHIKEHIIRETVKVNPIDHSEIRNVHEQTRLSIIKNPNVPIDLTMENHDLSDLDKTPNLKMPAEPQQNHMEPNNMLVQQLPLVSYDFHQNLYQQPHKVDQKVEPQHEHMMIQQLPSGGANMNYLQGSANSVAVAMPNKYMEGHMVNQPGPSQLSNVYLQAHTYPINYPINNPAINQNQSPQTVKADHLIQPVQETNFYMKPQTHEMEHMHHNVHEALPHNSNPQHEADPHQTHHDQQYQHLPLLDMINNFQGQNIERPMAHQEGHEQGPHVGESVNHDVHHGSVTGTATSSAKHVIKNAV